MVYNNGSSSLTELEIHERLNELWDYLLGSVQLPMPAMMLAKQFMPKLPELLADVDKQMELLQFLARLAWLIGYEVDFRPQQLVIKAIEEG